MIMNLSGGGKAKNVLAIWNGDSGATITATLGTKVLTTETDSSGYAFLTNLDAGTWTLQATKTGRYVGATTVTVTATQTAYYIKYPFQTYAYNGSLNDGGATGANVCADFSGGWTGHGVSGTTYYDITNIYRRLNAEGNTQTIYNNSAIDLTPFTTLYVTCQMNQPGRVGITTGNDMSNLTWRVYTTGSAATKTTFALDVSSFNNVTGYIVVGRCLSSVYLYDAWFE